MEEQGLISDSWIPLAMRFFLSFAIFVFVLVLGLALVVEKPPVENPCIERIEK